MCTKSNNFINYHLMQTIGEMRVGKVEFNTKHTRQGLTGNGIIATAKTGIKARQVKKNTRKWKLPNTKQGNINSTMDKAKPGTKDSKTSKKIKNKQ